MQAERGAGLTDITWSRLVYLPGRGWPDPRPSHRAGSPAGLAHGGGACPGRAAKSGAGAAEVRAGAGGFGGPCTPEHSHQEQGKQAGMGWGYPSISPRGGAAEGGHGPCLTGPSPPDLGPASAWGRQAMGVPSPSRAQLCASGGTGLRGGGGRHMGSGCSAQGLGDPRGPDPDFPDEAASPRLGRAWPMTKGRAPLPPHLAFSLHGGSSLDPQTGLSPAPGGPHHSSGAPAREL